MRYRARLVLLLNAQRARTVLIPEDYATAYVRARRYGSRYVTRQQRFLLPDGIYRKPIICKTRQPLATIAVGN